MSGRSIRDAIEMVEFAGEFRCYDGGGGIWIGNNRNISDGNFMDWGVAEAVTVIVNAVRDGKLVMAAPR